MARKAIPPTTIPAMAPPDSVWPCEPLPEEDGDDEAVGPRRELVASPGMGSPGLTWNVASLAAMICLSRVWVSLGLMTPTI